MWRCIHPPPSRHLRFSPLRVLCMVCVRKRYVTNGRGNLSRAFRAEKIVYSVERNVKHDSILYIVNNKACSARAFSPPRLCAERRAGSGSTTSRRADPFVDTPPPLLPLGAFLTPFISRDCKWLVYFVYRYFYGCVCVRVCTCAVVSACTYTPLKYYPVERFIVSAMLERRKVWECGGTVTDGASWYYMIMGKGAGRQGRVFLAPCRFQRIPALPDRNRSGVQR